MKKKSKKGLGNAAVAASAAKSIPKNVWIGLGVVALGLVGLSIYRTTKVIGDVGEKLGFSDSKEENEVKEFITTTSYKKAFDPNYHKKVKNAIAKELQIIKWADDLESAVGYFNDDENLIYATFKQIPTLADASRVSEQFYQKYKKDLYWYIFNALDNDTEFINVVRILKSKK